MNKLRISPQLQRSIARAIGKLRQVPTDELLRMALRAYHRAPVDISAYSEMATDRGTVLHLRLNPREHHLAHNLTAKQLRQILRWYLANQWQAYRRNRHAYQPGPTQADLNAKAQAITDRLLADSLAKLQNAENTLQQPISASTITIKQPIMPTPRI